MRARYQVIDPKDITIIPITLYESWETVDGVVYHKWRAEGEPEWHWRKTAQKEPPVLFWKCISQQEYDGFYKDRKDDGNPKV